MSYEKSKFLAAFWLIKVPHVLSSCFWRFSCFFSSFFFGRCPAVLRARPGLVLQFVAGLRFSLWLVGVQVGSNEHFGHKFGRLAILSPTIEGKSHAPCLDFPARVHIFYIKKGSEMQEDANRKK